MYLCTFKSKEVMTTKKDIPIPFLLLPAMGGMPLSSIWLFGKNNFDERCPAARFVGVGR